MALVDLETAKAHLRMDSDAEDADIQFKLEQASAIVVDYLKLPEGKWQVGESSASVAPWPVQAAVMLVLGALFKDREGGDPLSQAVKDLIHRYRDPALA